MVGPRTFKKLMVRVYIHTYFFTVKSQLCPDKSSGLLLPLYA